MLLALLLNIHFYNQELEIGWLIESLKIFSHTQKHLLVNHF